MGLAIFENYSETIEGTNHAPFIVDIPRAQCFETIKKWVQSKNFEQVDINNIYFEIFYIQEEFEFTILIGNDGENALVNASVFGKTGKTRKKLNQLLKELIDLFK